MDHSKWLKLAKKTDPELPYEPPIWLGDHSNGEIYHQQTERERLARKLILTRADEKARYHGMERRAFLASSMGMALSLSVINLVNGCSSAGSAGVAGAGGRTGLEGGAGTGGGYQEPDDFDDPDSCAVIIKASDYFIFDIQTHHVARTNATYATFLRILPQGNCGKGIPGCYSVDEYARRMFLESDTTISVLSGIPAIDGQNPLTNEEIAQSRDIINRFAENSQRVVNHCMVLPNYNTDAQFAGMQNIKERFGVAAWKCYTPWGPGAGNTGWLFTDDVGLRFIERGRELGVRLFCAHKGLPLPGFDNTFGDPKDIGVVAKMFPDVGFIVYHSAYEFNGGDETQPFARTGDSAYRGVNSLVNALLDNGIKPNANVYGELGTTWYNVRNDPTAASHVLGKLLKYVGEDNVVWGTDCMWYGSPQPIIESFVAFQISDQFQQQYGYPALTPAIKAKVLGLNAARAYGVNPKATRCAVNASELAALKRNLDAEFGSRRWALQKPVLRTRRDFLSHVAEHRAKGTPG